MPPKFPNLWSAQFGAEIEEANNAATQEGSGPSVAVHDRGKWYDSNNFRPFVQGGQKFKWVLNQKGDLGVINPPLKHSIAAGGGDVDTAGHAHYIAATNTLVLDNDAGHYQTTVESLKLAKTAWEYLGYNLDFKARRDFAQLF